MGELKLKKPLVPSSSGARILSELCYQQKKSFCQRAHFSTKTNKKFSASKINKTDTFNKLNDNLLSIHINLTILTCWTGTFPTPLNQLKDVSMLRKIFACGALLLASQFAGAQIVNGNFESFSGNTPTGWTTIDGSISVAPSSVAFEGSRSVAVTVNTTSQSATDFLQSIPVVANQTYNFSARIRHTEGGMRARFYINGFRNYSNPALTNQWQQINYSYTPTSSGNILVGLRFYDVSGFDGSEIVYVDDFQPSSGSTGGSSSCSGTEVNVAINTDQYGSETSWQILNAASQAVESGSGYASNASASEDFCLSDGNYTFVINDSFGDGICCGFGNGSYAVTAGATTLASGGEFASQESTPFTIGGSSTPPSACSANEVSLSLQTDQYGSETSWQLNRGSTQVATGSGYSNNSLNTEDFCLSDGNYTFVINDSFGDGICCSFGNGFYRLTSDGSELVSGGQFGSSESMSFSLPASGNGGGGNTGSYYDSAQGLSGFALKSALHDIIDNHSNQGYGSLWTFYSANERDVYYENDGSILDIYSERPNAADAYNYTPVSDQCGNFNSEADCYNREHAFPRSWFGGDVEPMNSDVHHIFPSDGQVNSYRSSFPYGEVGSATITTTNGSRRGNAVSGLGYSGTVFEPIDEFKGDLARAYFYMATRYEDVISGWENNSSTSDAVLNGSSNRVFETWVVNLLLDWHAQDPVSQKEIDRNEAAFGYQGNRNPFVDNPAWVNSIWGN